MVLISVHRRALESIRTVPDIQVELFSVRPATKGWRHSNYIYPASARRNFPGRPLLVWDISNMRIFVNTHIFVLRMIPRTGLVGFVSPYVPDGIYVVVSEVVVLCCILPLMVVTLNEIRLFLRVSTWCISTCLYRLARPRARWCQPRGLPLVGLECVCLQCNGSFVSHGKLPCHRPWTFPSISQELTRNNSDSGTP